MRQSVGVGIDQCPNRNVRRYHVREQLTEASIEMSSNTDAGAVTQTLASMRGVTQVFVERYSVSISKGEAFDWDEVEPAILEFLAAFTSAGEPNS